jgi:hypothetical protein
MTRFPFALAGVVLLLAGCAASNWPGDATVTGHNSADSKIFHLYDHASTKNPGTEQDLREIKQAILGYDSSAKINSIRWISATKAIADIELHNPTYAGFFYALEKDAKGWRLVTTYLWAAE